jgi:HSP20 family protein
MKPSRWEPLGSMWQQMQQLQHEMNRLFERWTGGAPGWSFGAAAEFPPVNVWEDAEAVHVSAELPGLDLKDLEIYVTNDNQLTLKGERKQTVPPQAVFHRQERSFGGFARVLPLPAAVNSDNVEARLENGVLRLRLAKHESVRPRKIVVKGD